MAHTSLVTPSMPSRDISSLQNGVAAQREIAGTPAPAAAPTQSDSERFMHIVQATGSVISHYDLFIFPQSKVQHFVPHQIMNAA